MPDVPFYLLLPIAWQYVISSRFNSPRSYPFAPQRLQLHEGIDFAPEIGGQGSPLYVRASQRGIVDKIGFDARGYGNYVRIVHNWGTRALRHLVRASRRGARQGEPVRQRRRYHRHRRVNRQFDRHHVHLTLQHIGKGLKNYVVADVVDPEPFLASQHHPV